MPKIASHQQRRDKISLLVANMIAETGLGEVTIRSIAKESGYSTRSVTYYFPDKRAMLLQVYQDAGWRLRHRIDEVLARDPLDLLGLLQGLLPTDEDAVREWKVNFAFWDLAVTDRELREFQRNSVRKNIQRIGEILDARKLAGKKTLTNSKDARRLLLIVQGLAVQALFEPDYWTPAVQHAFLLQEVERLD